MADRKTGLFFGSDTGNTENTAVKIIEMLDKDIDLINVFDAKAEDFTQYDNLILGLSTWHDGELQSDWDTFFMEFSEIDFTNKTIALFGLGDQYVYADYFVDGIGIIGEVVINNGGKIIGKWSTEGYEHTESKAEIEEGIFLGLALDEDNQPELKDKRIKTWTKQIVKEFNID